MYWNSKKKTKEIKEIHEEKMEEPVVYMHQLPPELGGSSGVEVDENKIYYYSPIQEKEILELNRIVKKLDYEMQYLSIRLGIPTPPIELHIHSDGGSAFAGLAAYDAIKACKSPIHTYIDGSAASAATLLFLAGTERFVNRNSFMLIHQVSALVHGKFEELKDELKNQEKIMHNVRNIYLETSNLPEEKIVDLMKHDLWLDAETVLKYGFATKKTF